MNVSPEAMPMSVVPAKSRTREIDCDLLVIGSGAAGLSAAVTAAWHGLKVIVAEKDAVCGGATA
jgi:succinate dehydrogenase/fumarate reductase flavoprotein subunit